MKDHTYTVIKKPDGVHIELTAPTGYIKRFFQAGDVPTEPFVRHMESLTDSQCSDWFKQRKQQVHHIQT